MSHINFSFAAASFSTTKFQGGDVNSKIANSLRNTANGLNNGCGADPLTKAMKSELNNLADMFDGGAGKCQHGRQNLNINMSFSGNNALARGISVSVGDPCANKCGSKGGDPLGQNMLNALNPLQMGAAALGFGAAAAMAPFAMLGNLFGQGGMPQQGGGNMSMKAKIKMDGHGNGKAKFEFNDGNTKLKVKIKNCHGKLKIKIKMKQKRQVQNQQNINIKINGGNAQAQGAHGNYSAQMAGGSGSAGGSKKSGGGDGLGIGSLAGLTFEQMVHKFMMKQAKEQQEKVKGMMEKMKAADSKGGGKGGAAGKAGGAGGKGGAGGAGGSGGAEGKGETSKAAQMEELKFEIQQLTQMMQALSGVNNTMHQNCMNAVRNIRA